jgi:hypothetical protein
LDRADATLVSTGDLAVLVRGTGSGEASVRWFGASCERDTTWRLRTGITFGSDLRLHARTKATCHHGHLIARRSMLDVGAESKATSISLVAHGPDGAVRALDYDISSLDRTQLPDAPVPTYDELPVGDPTTIPWWQDGRLHLGDMAIDTDRSGGIVSRNGTTIVNGRRWSSARRGAYWFLVRGDHLVRLPMAERADSGPLMSADGAWIAWLEERPAAVETRRRWVRYRVVLFDVAQQAIVNAARDRRFVDREDAVNGVWLRTVSNDGTVVFTRGHDGRQALSSTGIPVDLLGPRIDEGRDVDGWPGGTSFYDRGRTIYGTVGPDGTFVEVGRFRGADGQWSPDGTSFAHLEMDRTAGLSVTTIDGKTADLGFPRDLTFATVVGWESDDAVVVWKQLALEDGEPTGLVRCFVSTQECEQVPDGPGAGSWATFPGLGGY